jgi:hypothetical protein
MTITPKSSSDPIVPDTPGTIAPNAIKPIDPTIKTTLPETQGGLTDAEKNAKLTAQRVENLLRSQAVALSIRPNTTDVAPTTSTDASPLVSSSKADA